VQPEPFAPPPGWPAPAPLGTPGGPRPPLQQPGGWPADSYSAPPAQTPPALRPPQTPPPPPIPAPGGRAAPARGRSPLRTALLALIALAIIAAGGTYILTHRTATPAPAPSASAQATATATPAPTPTPSPGPTPTPAPSASPSAAALFTDPGHDFAAAFPVTPASVNGSESESGVTISYTTWEAEDVTTGDQYLAIYMPYPSAVSVSDPQLSLQAGVNSMVTNLGVTVISQVLGTYDGYPDDDVLVSLDGVYLDYRFILAGHDFYGFAVASAQNPPPGFTSFVGSVQLYSTAPAPS